MVQNAKLEGIKGFQDEKTKGVSPWLLSLEQELGEERPASGWSYSLSDFQFNIFEGDQSLWILITFPQGGEVALRAAYCPYNHITIRDMKALDDGVENSPNRGVELQLGSVTGEYSVKLEFLHPDRPLIRCTTTLRPAAPLFVPYFPAISSPWGAWKTCSVQKV